MVLRGRQTLINITRPVLVLLLLLVVVVVREGGRFNFERSVGDIFSRLVRRSSRPDCRVASPWMAKTGVVSDLVELSTERRMRSAVRKMDLAPSLDGGWIHMYRSVMWLLFFSFSLRCLILIMIDRWFLITYRLSINSGVFFSKTSRTSSSSSQFWISTGSWRNSRPSFSMVNL